MSKSKYSGTVQHSDLEGGVWLLKTDAGVVYQLKGGDTGLKRDGLRVEVEGRIDAQSFGIAMMGEILEVDSYRVLG